MTRTSLCGVFLLSLSAAAGCAPSLTPEQQLVVDAANAIGGAERVRTLRSMRMEGEGRQFNLGQDMRPGASGQTFTVTGWIRRVDLAGNRSRTELTRTPNFAYFQGPAPQRQEQGIDGDAAYNLNAKGTATRVGGQAVADRRADLRHHPVTALRSALSPDAKLTNLRPEGTGRALDVTSGDLTFTLVVDAASLPLRVQSASYHPNLGDVTMTTAFADYRDVAGWRLPHQLTTSIDDFVMWTILPASYVMDGDVGNLAMPEGTAAAAAPAAPNVVPRVIAPGVWLLAGQSHHSALIELSDRLLLIEAPQTEARTLAAITAARGLVKGKPLSTLVMTHHHFDHTAGLRAAVAEGLSVITHEGNRAFVDEMVKRPHTRTADHLARQPRPVSVEGVAASHVIKDPLRSVELHHVAGNPHSDTMLMAYLPKERVLFQVDAYSPGSATHPYAANLLQNISDRKLNVTQVVPLHGEPTTLAELRKVVGTP